MNREESTQTFRSTLREVYLLGVKSEPFREYARSPRPGAVWIALPPFSLGVPLSCGVVCRGHELADLLLGFLDELKSKLQAVAEAVHLTTWCLQDP